MISHKYKCIFIHIPKTGGMSINNFFHPNTIFYQDVPNYDILFGWCPKRKLHMQHATAKQLLETELITQEIWDDYYKFTFVRNPWDRVYSDYLWIQQFTNIKGKFKDFVNKKGVFETILNDNSNSNYLGDHLLPQLDFFDLKGKLSIDYIGNFENFNSDIKKILGELDMKEEFDVYLNKGLKRKKDYSLFYTNSRKNIIKEKYKNDIEKFNYSFQDNRKGLFALKKYL